jgi:hypothetical protein
VVRCEQAHGRDPSCRLTAGLDGSCAAPGVPPARWRGLSEAPNPKHTARNAHESCPCALPGQRLDSGKPVLASHTMKARYGQFNPKRRLLTPVQAQARATELGTLAERVEYGGNPEHKKNPGDFNLIPPSNPRQGKALCDVAKIFRREEAVRLLQAGLRSGLVSDRMAGEWPKNVWSVTADGFALEAQLENPESGTYHGYPMPETDPLSLEVKRRWERLKHV